MGRKPGVGVFTQTHATRHPVPWDKVSIGETVWMKWAGGPIVAKATVQGCRQIEQCTASALRATTARYGLRDLVACWNRLPPVFFGMTVYLQDEAWLDEVITPRARSRGESWIVVSNPAQAREWLSSA